MFEYAGWVGRSGYVLYIENGWYHVAIERNGKYEVVPFRRSELAGG